MLKYQYYFLIFLVFCFLPSCFSFKYSTPSGLTNTEDAFINGIPSLSEWKTDRDAMLKYLNDKKGQNELISKKAKRSSTFFVIGGTAAGLGGGIYGLTANNEDSASKAAGITSLVTGALTTVLATLKSQEVSERSDICSSFIETQIAKFKLLWTDANYPNDTEKYKSYLEDKKEAIDALTQSKCLGNLRTPS